MEPITFVFADRAIVPGFLGIDVQEHVVEHLLELKPDKILLVCDETAGALHPQYLSLLQPSGCAAAPGETGDGFGRGGTSAPMPAVEQRLLPPGDSCKSWDHLSDLMRWAFEVGATKRSLVVGFGGGALMNVAGLFASILYRGTKLVYIPTTLLAMHDVTTSLKTSICYDGRKNNIGSFYAPAKILIDVSFCKTLPRGELFSGLGELAKNAVLFGGKHANGFVAALSKERIDAEHGGSGDEFVMDEQTLMSLLSLGIEAKMSVLAKDAYEKGSGMIFEYGHTVSHAIEKAYGDGIVPHGLGVTYGMLSSSYAAEKLGIMTPEDRREHDDLCWLLLSRWPLPEPKPTIERVMALAMRDSKRGVTSEAEDEISDVMLRRMGDVVHTNTSMLSKFPCHLVAEWLATMGFPSASGEGLLTAEECKALIDDVGGRSERALVGMGFEPLTVGFANRVCGVERRGQPLVVKRYTDLVFLRIEPAAIGAVDVLAGEANVGPRVLHAGPQGLVMERILGRTLDEEDMHKGDACLLAAVARALAMLHRLPVPAVCDGEPMLWRTIDKMMQVAACKPELWPPAGVPGAAHIAEAVAAMRAALERHRPQVVLSHGDFKPSNVILCTGLAEELAVKIIDFELGGPNYRGFDLMKVFRTSAVRSQPCMEHFLRVYSAEHTNAATGDAGGSGDSDGSAPEDLLAETCLFEPLTWLEAAVFFLTLPQFKPEDTPKWHELAADRWAKFEQTKGKLL